MSKKFYDDDDIKKYHSKYDDFDAYFKAHKGKDHKGGQYKVRKRAGDSGLGCKNGVFLIGNIISFSVVVFFFFYFARGG